MEAGTLVEWRKKPGDLLQPGDIIAEVDTQKGLIEIEVFEAGILDKYLISKGDKVPVGTPMASIRPEGSAAEPEEISAEELHPIMEKEQPAVRTASLPTAITSEEEVSSLEKPSEEKKSQEKHRIKISPLARSIAIKNNIDITTLTGTGEDGAITKADVKKAMTGKKEAVPETPPKKEILESSPEPGNVEEETISGKITSQESGKTAPGSKEPAPAKHTNPQESIRAAVAAAMSRSNRDIPHYYLEKRIHMQAAMTWLKESNRQRAISGRLLPAVLFIKAVAKAIDSAPQLNAVWDNGIQLKNEVNIGFVVSLRAGGLLVPAIRNADTKSPDEIMTSLNDLITRARALKLRSSELSESTITITSLGENGSDKVFGVIYPPQVAIVGFGSIVDEPVVHNDMLAIVPVVHVTLAGDHRATDGLTGSRFLEALNTHLQNPEAL